MKIIVDANDEIIPILKRLEKKMADVTTEINDLVSAVSDVSTDVGQVLAELAQAPNITDAQRATLEAQTAALKTLDAQVKAAIPATPPPPPAPQVKG